MRVLIVDDSAFARERIVQLAMAAGHEAFQATGGQEALRLISEIRPDAVTVDLLMPGMDGIELIEKLHATHPFLPVIAVSADVQDATRRQVLAAGAVAFVSKAGRLTELLNVLEALPAARPQPFILDLLQRDAFTEMMNLAMGQAANALASLLERRVLLTVPKVEIMRVTALRIFLEQRLALVGACVRQYFQGALTGSAVLLFPADHAQMVVRAALNNSDHPTGSSFAEVEIGVLAELGNVVLNAAISQLGDQISERLAIGLPTVQINLPVAAFVDSLRIGLNSVDHAIILLSRLTVGEVNLVCYLILLLPEAGVRRLLDSLEV